MFTVEATLSVRLNGAIEGVRFSVEKADWKKDFMHKTALTSIGYK